MKQKILILCFKTILERCICTKNKIVFLLAALLALTNVSAVAVVQTTPPVNTEYEQRVVQLVNKERQAYGLSELYYDPTISNVARTKSQDMAVNRYFDHRSPTYGMANEMLSSFGITWSAWGENIAAGQETPEKVVAAWMASPTHRQNILAKHFTFLGVGYYVDSSGTPYWTQMFTTDDK